MKIKQSILRNLIKESIKNYLKEENVVTFQHQFGMDGLVTYGKDNNGWFVHNKANGGVQRFNSEEEAKLFGEKLYKQLSTRQAQNIANFRSQELNESADGQQTRYGKIVGEYQDGIAKVARERNGQIQYTFVDMEGRAIALKSSGLAYYFDEAHDFVNGFAAVHDAAGWNFLDRRGRFLLKQSLENIENLTDFDESGKAHGILDGKEVVISSDGKISEPKRGVSQDKQTPEVDSVEGPGDMVDIGSQNKVPRMSGIESDSLTNLFLSKIQNGEKVRQGMFKSGWAKVELNGFYNFINKNRDLISPNLWFKVAGEFNEEYDNYAIVKMGRTKGSSLDEWGNKPYFLGKDGTLLLYNGKGTPNIEYPEESDYMQRVYNLGNLRKDSLDSIKQKRSELFRASARGVKDDIINESVRQAIKKVLNK